MRRWLLLALVWPALAFAHGGGAHLNGEVVAVAAKSVSIRDADGEVRLVAVDDRTEFMLAGHRSEAARVAPGQRAKVHLRKDVRPPLAARVILKGAPAPRRVEIEVTADGFVVRDPKPLTAGQPAELVVTRKVDRTCATDIVLKEFGLSAPLPLGKPVSVVFTPRSAGKVRFACAMDMVRGELDVK